MFRRDPCHSAHFPALDLAAAAHLTVELVGPAGRRVAVLRDGLQGLGRAEILWTGCDGQGACLRSGVHLCRARAGAEAITRRIVLAK